MSLYKPKGSKIWVMDFMFHSQRIRESTGTASKSRGQQDRTEEAVRLGGRRRRHTAARSTSIAFRRCR